LLFGLRGHDCLTNLDHALGLFFQTRGQAIEFHDQHRSGVEWKTK